VPALPRRAPSGRWRLRVALRPRDHLSVEAVEQLGRSGIVVLHARAQLTYGEWLRRGRRRVDAREQLKEAHTAFAAMGAMGFADRARRELLATGETVRKRTDDARDDLTPQEAQIARLASDRLTNPEIKACRWLSPGASRLALCPPGSDQGSSLMRSLGWSVTLRPSRSESSRRR
jgi:hypothetical protein